MSSVTHGPVMSAPALRFADRPLASHHEGQRPLTEPRAGWPNGCRFPTGPLLNAADSWDAARSWAGDDSRPAWNPSLGAGRNFGLTQLRSIGRSSAPWWPVRLAT